jgi:ABC-2 type transport system ATP-binding protein
MTSIPKPAQTDDVLVIKGLTKTFGKGGDAVQANNNVDLTVAVGEVVCLLGHNGAGKSTLVNHVVGITMPDAGTIVLDGVDAVANPARARQLASVQAQTNAPITGVAPRKAIELVGRLRGLKKAEARQQAQALLTALDFEESWANRASEKVSGGVARLTAFAMAVVAPGRLVVLDEPTNDVDPVRRRLLWQEIRRVAEDGAGVLVVTHNVHEAEMVVDKVVLLDQGRVITVGSPTELKSRFGMPTLEDVYIHLVGDESASRDLDDKSLTHALTQTDVKKAA